MGRDPAPQSQAGSPWESGGLEDRLLVLLIYYRCYVTQEYLTTAAGRIASVSPSYPGSHHDISIRRAEPSLPEEAPGLSHMTFSKLNQEAAQERVIPPGSLKLSLH